ncbi:2-C-methyl-D-erythritol 4-phosphate cytidylyltransferase [Dyadobacter sp. CY323]|uniref:2-C-methyl-D-erythritol 4-phosphate cytidylyltransferase n=1 Tax=Dyadobacter sp. CY323 TaxID=2907302 RepID=UPI001F488F26|nr:2-C-methyl-D-erythritol 4-phosphate cytidylyltransferase [Dyadobacter sp. CY323]MCE6992323.1 2-C-methyl-D-erythritol 4-phosphate cytidylyltransferase [Dyadobacter sp. CY323]
MQEFAIIVAGGSGSRMKSDISKQFLSINGLPVLMHTILAFRTYSAALEIIVVLPENQFNFWRELCQLHEFRQSYRLVAGGETRFHSVRNGLDQIVTVEGLVAVHDGVRPIISKQIIAESFSNSREYGTAVVSVPLKDSIRIVHSKNENKTANRADFRLIQTPQTFRLDWMRNAFDTPYQETFTDCASVLEAKGYPIHLIDGEYENIKITTPEDLLWAEVYLRK